MKAFRILGSFVAVAAFAALAACGGSGSSGSPSAPLPGAPGGAASTPPSSTPSPVPTASANTVISSPAIGVSSAIVHAAPGAAGNGDASWYTSGATAWSSNAGSTPSGANGNNTIDGVACTQMAEPANNTNFHVHAFVGIYYNGNEEAIPSAIGMKHPTQPSPQTSPVPSAACFYKMHTHDYSGLIHVEDATLASSAPVPSYATLKTVFDLWGEPLNANQVAAFTGPVAIYVGNTTVKASNGSDLVTNYAPFNGDLTTIGLGHHVAIWIVVGTPPAALPQVEFGIES